VPKVIGFVKSHFRRLGAFFEGPKARFASLRVFSKKCQYTPSITFYRFVKIQLFIETMAFIDEKLRNGVFHTRQDITFLIFLSEYQN
jgi:hypothetical protein